MYTSEFILLVSSSVTSSMQTSKSVPEAAVHDQVMTLPPPYFIEVVDNRAQGIPLFLPKFHHFRKGLFWYCMSIKLLQSSGSAHSNLSSRILLLLRGLHLAV